jgi:hypothetical protein
MQEPGEPQMISQEWRFLEIPLALKIDAGILGKRKKGNPFWLRLESGLFWKESL